MATETTLFASFLMLPAELSDQIFGELAKADLQRLRLACRALSKSRIIQEKLFNTLYIHLYNKPSKVLPLVSFCAAGKHCARAKRNLKALFSVQRRLVKALIEILPHLNGVTMLKSDISAVCPLVSQPNMINKPLVDSLTSMPSISENEPRFPSGFHDLERFTMHGILNETDFTSLLQHSCRTLTHLTCRIGELRLANVSHHWRGIPLRSIYTNYDFPATVWKAFSTTRICLEHVTVRHPIQRAGLLAYLDSYSGLRSLSIRTRLRSTRSRSTSIDICPMNHTSWSCDAEALLALNQCTRLSLLRVNIDPQQSSNPIAVFLDLLPSWCNLSDITGVDAETSASAFRSFQDTYAMKMLHFRCFIWKIAPEVFEDDSYGFSATVCQNGNPHDGEPYRGADQHVRSVLMYSVEIR
ncbi:hypothetical protein BDZ89DRAFT_1063870 [Hymenopellis radicata]|nr:hypothetical protein BDZ89DRAFT_1063870 [Hymenopellis radicata]